MIVPQRTSESLWNIPHAKNLEKLLEPTTFAVSSTKLSETTLSDHDQPIGEDDLKSKLVSLYPIDYMAQIPFRVIKQIKIWVVKVKIKVLGDFPLGIDGFKQFAIN